MPLRVAVRPDTGTLWIVGTVRPAGTKTGVRVRQRAGSDDRRIAAEEAAAIEARILRDAHHGARAGQRSFAAACQSYLTHQDRSAGTIALVRRLLLHWQETPLAEITQDAVDASRPLILRPGAGDDTWRRTAAALSAVLNHAARRGWCDAPRFDLPAPAPSRTAYLLPAQYEALEAAAAPHLRPLLRYLVCTGSRLGEALSLEWPQVDLRGGRVNVWADQTKGGRRRVVDLPPAAVMALAALPHRTGHVFLTHRGAAYPPSDIAGGQIATAWARAAGVSGLPGRWIERRDRPALVRPFADGRARAPVRLFRPEHSPHDLRHTFASWHYALHHDLLALKTAGGWSSVELVERYAHLLPAGHEAAIRRVWGLNTALRQAAGVTRR